MSQSVRWHEESAINGLLDESSAGAGSAPHLLSQNRAFLFGDGFFTTIAVRDHQIEFLSAHLKRIEQSLSALRFPSININQMNESISQRLNCLAQRQRSFTARITLWRSQQKRGYGIATNVEIHLLLSIAPLPEPCAGLAAITSDISLAGNSVFGPIKHLNRLPQVMAASTLNKPNEECLLSWRQGWICGSRSNLFYRLNGEWCTPPVAEAGVNGIIRQQVLAAMAEAKIEIVEISLAKSDLERLESAFMTNSLIKACPVLSLNGRQLCSEVSEGLFVKTLGRTDLWGAPTSNKTVNN